MRRALPGSEYYGGSAPSRTGQPTAGSAHPPGAGGARERAGPGRFPCSLRFAQRRRSPALPLRHRHGYPAALHRGLPGRHPHACPEVPRPDRAGAHRARPLSARF